MKPEGIPKTDSHAMFSRLLLLFILIPAAELYLLIRLGQWIGVMETFGIILVTGIMGSWMAKTQGLAVWKEFNAKMAQGRVPGKELSDGLIILISGALLLTPGILTDFVGLLGLFPPTRALVRDRLSRALLSNSHVMMGGAMPNSGSTGPRRGPDASRDDAGNRSGMPNVGPDTDSGWSGSARSHPGYNDAGT